MSDWLTAHVDDLNAALAELPRQAAQLARWGQELADHLAADGRVLAAGNGGSAAEAQHLTAELVGRFLAERRPLSAVCLSAETSSLTAILNDYGAEEVFARQAEAHGRPGDVLILLSTSGRSPNLLEAARRGRAAGLRVWAMTGPAPNPLAALADETFCVQAQTGCSIQEVHLIAVHAVCAAVDERLQAMREADRIPA
jgi:D-sedoheptulose 7-phosphate isomerase